MIRIVAKYRYLMNSHNQTLLLLDVAFKVIFCVFFLPLLSYGLNYVIRLWGQSYITIKNVISFLTFPPTVILIVLLIILLSFGLFIEITTIIYYCSTEKTMKNPNLLYLMFIGFRKSLHSIISGNIFLPFYTILLFILTNLPILIGFTVYAHIDLPGGASDEAFLKGLIILILIFISFIAFRGIFVIYFCMIEQQHLKSSLEQSKLLIKGHGIKTVSILILYNVVLTIAFFLFYYAILFLTALLVYLLADKSMVITVFLSIYPKINIYTFIFFSIITFITNINIISSRFIKYREDYFTDLQPKESRFPETPLPLTVKKHKLLFTSILLFIFAAGIFNFYLTVRNDTFYLKDALSGIMISSHRGNSHVAPENTIPALENAMIAYSDYAEIDIQQTKDGVLILMHDQSLWRTTGLNQYVWEFTYEEIKELDAGYWFGQEFKGTTIPTLNEVLEFCKGRIKLNIEVKITGHEQNIEKMLIDMIEQYNFERQCVISSWDYDTLVRMKQLNSDIKTGYIMSAAYGNFYEKEFIDFFSIRYGFISKHVVDSAHRAGKEVHAWTVNSVGELERMKSLGVDCIITDNPTLAREILYRNDANKTLIELLYRMLYNRSFYNIVQN